jgi:hypothetical protein
MDDKQTRIKDDDEASSEEEDVLEAQGRMIWMKSTQQLRFGTVSTGFEFGSLVWPKGQYILRVESKDLRQKFHGRPIAEQSVVVGRMNATRLRKSKLDCLLVDGTTIDWSSWLGDVAEAADPNVIICMAPESCTNDDQEGPISSAWRKRMRQKGYTARYWHMNADEYGAALNQSRLAVVYFKAAESDEDEPQYPTPFELPARAMSNLLLPASRSTSQGLEQTCGRHGHSQSGTKTPTLSYY